MTARERDARGRVEALLLAARRVFGPGRATALAGDLAAEAGLEPAVVADALDRWLELWPDDEELTALFVQAAAQVIRRQRQLAQQLSEDPKLKDGEDFRRAVLDLDEAHRLCFGRTLMDYLLEEDRDHGNA